MDGFTEGEYASQSKLYKEFASMSTIDKAWAFKSSNGLGTQTMFSLSQPNLLSNKKKKLILSSLISEDSNGTLNVQWAPFPIEVTGASLLVPSPSGSKLLVVRNPEGDSSTRFEIWGKFQLEKEILVPQSVHVSVYSDGWFEGISWSPDENLIAYVAEEPGSHKPTFNDTGYKKDAGPTDKDCSSWKGQGDLEEDWGEAYSGKKQPALFVIDINSGDVRAVDVGRSISVGQVVWAPPTKGLHQYLVFVGWPLSSRKFGMKYCTNRPCALYAARGPLFGSEINENAINDVSVINLSQGTCSAFLPRFTPDGKFLVFLSAKSAVESGAHNATNSLHKIEWDSEGKPHPVEIIDVVPVVMCPEDGHFPGIYCFDMISSPWLSDGSTMILSSIWGSTEVILSVNVLSGNVSRITPDDSNHSWNLLTLDGGNNILAVCSGPTDVPQIKYGSLTKEESKDAIWRWQDVSSPPSKCQEKVKSLLSSLQFDILKILVKSVSDNLTKGACKPFDAIFVSSKSKHDTCDPLIVILHGGPQDVSLTSFSKTLAFLASIGFSLLIVNYRGSLGFGEEALQSLPGKVGSQDVNDVLAAIDHAIDMGLANPLKITVVGLSHGGFLTAHLIGQAPNKFVAACVRNPVCNLALMVGTSDIPDWCFVEAFGTKGLSTYTEAPSPELLSLFYEKSPISHVSKVKTKDIRVPVTNGLQFARALKEKGVPLKVIVFPEDIHPINRLQSDFESFVNIGVWFKTYCRD